jgi:hypothetical protein
MFWFSTHKGDWIMKTLLLNPMLWALMLSTTFAQQPQPAGADKKPTELENVPTQVDKHEIDRWGPRVVVSGEGPRAGEEVLFSKAMAPPEDDSDRWFITLWGPSNDPVTLKWKTAFESSKLAAFVADPPAGLNRKAWAHFNFLHSDDATQKWRFDDYKISLSGPFPVITVNPPRKKNDQGQFLWGDPTVVVDRIDAPQLSTPEALFTRIQASVDKFCKMLVRQGRYPVSLMPNAGGPDIEHQTVYLSHAPNGAHAQQPFPWGPSVPPPATPFNPVFPPPFGPATPVVPDKLTLEQIKAAIPDAPADYLVEVYLSGPTDASKVQMAWMMKKLQPVPVKPVDPTPAPVPNGNWTSMILPIVMALFGGGSVGGLIVFFAQLFRTNQKANHRPLLIPNDATFDELLNVFKNFAIPVIPVPRTVAPVPMPAPAGTIVSRG